MRKDLLWRFDVVRKVLKINKERSWSRKSVTGATFFVERFNKIVYGEKNIEEIWGAIFQTFNTVRPGLVEKICKNYPDLTENELRIGILAYVGFSIKETALILDLSPNTIQTRRTDVLRKMGLDSRGDIADHIDQL